MRRALGGFLLVLATAIMPIASVRSQTAAEEAASATANANDPEARRIANSYTSALLQLRFEDASTVVHSSALASIRRVVDLLMKQDEDGSLRMQLLKAGTAAEQAKLSDRQVFACFIGQVMMQQGVGEVLKSSKSTMLGAIAEGPALHFVGRTEITMEGFTISKLDVLSMQKEDGVWRVLLSGELSGMVAALEAQAKP